MVGAGVGTEPKWDGAGGCKANSQTPAPSMHRLIAARRSAGMHEVVHKRTVTQHKKEKRQPELALPLLSPYSLGINSAENKKMCLF